MKYYSENMQRHYHHDLMDILNAMEPGVPVYTHHFEFLKPRNYGFVGKDNRPHLRKCLWTLVELGLIQNINLGNNIHKWKITQDGILYR